MKIPYIIGLTGGIASGKSYACEILGGLGAYIIDADIVARKVVQPGSAGYAKLKASYPDFFSPAGELNRKSLREFVFMHGQVAKLNGLMHVLIREEIDKEISCCGKDLVVLAAPLLFEAGMQSDVQVVVSVMSSRELRIERLMERDNITKELAEKMLENQTDDRVRLEHSDYIIWNEGDLKEFADKVTEVYGRIKKRAQEIF